MKRIVIAMVASVLLSIAPATAYGASRNCDTNAVVYCGASGKSELISKLSKGDSKQSGAALRADYRSVSTSMTSSAISSSTTVQGYVYKDGHVTAPYKNGKPSKTNTTVATNAYSYGRQNMPGSTKEGDLYKRPTSASFTSDRLPALVHFKDGQFAWAIILACGNPVVATPVVPKVTTTAKKVPAPTPPAPVTTIYTTQIVEQHQIVHAASTPPPAVAPVATTLPDTGSRAAGSIVGLAAIAIAAATFVRSRQRRLTTERQRSS